VRREVIAASAFVANFHPHNFLLPFSSGGCLSADQMNQMDDWQLLRDYATRNSEEAFRALVDRYAGLVYHAALRQAGNPHTAEEVTQAVFIALAQKADRIPRGAILSGWLFRATRFACNNLAREQIRRQRREQEAVMMETILRPDDTASVWEQIVPHLNDALERLPRKDREAVLVRFFQDKSHRELARTLGVSEDASKVRISRALEKLRLIFARQGFAVPSAVLLATISAHGAQAAPAGLTASVASVAVTNGTAGTTSTLTIAKGVLKIMAWTKAKTAIVIGASMLLAAGTATVTVKKIQEHRTYPWQVRNFDSRVVDKVPPQVMIVPTIFPDSESWGSANGKFLGSGASIRDIVRTTYDKSLARTVLSTELPPGKYDYIANLPRGSAEALQKEIQRKFGVVGRREMRETDVLLLMVKSRNAPGLRPSTTRRNSSLSNEGNRFSCVNLPLTGLVDYLEYYLGIPVVDQTSLTRRFDIDLKVNEQDWQQHNPDALKQVLLDQLGLELVPTNMPIEMLVVEKVE
jgi:uncharacterized protein (TIGR03435 family)